MNSCVNVALPTAAEPPKGRAAPRFWGLLPWPPLREIWAPRRVAGAKDWGRRHRTAWVCLANGK